MAEVDPGYLTASIESVTLKKYNNSDSISLIPQMMEFNIYQSIMSPMMSAEMLLYDPIGLTFNYPLLGEETIEIKIKPTSVDLYNYEYTDRAERLAAQQTITLTFMVASVSPQVVDDTARSTMYVIKMYTSEMRKNALWRVQRAYKDQYHNIIKSILKDYLEVPNIIQRINDANFEETKGTLPFIVPNLHPLEAIALCTKRAVALNDRHFLYTFYENFNGYNFKTVQAMAEVVKQYDLYYVSDMNPEVRTLTKDIDYRVITALSINKTFNTLQKTVTGFYDNEYYEIDVFNKKVVNKQLNPPNTVINGISGNNQPNTLKFMNENKIDNERQGTRTRVRYTVSQGGGDDPEYPNGFSDKFGAAVQSLSALAQAGLTLAAPGHTTINAGDVINIKIPEFHGFNEVEEDRYKSGRYLIINIKHSFSIGHRHIMTLDVAKDAFTNPVKEVMEYKVF